MTMADPKDIRPSEPGEHERRMEQARKRAAWELGDPSWAGIIVGAYLWPDSDREALEAEKRLGDLP